jgi:hypothetical protein
VNSQLSGTYTLCLRPRVLVLLCPTITFQGLGRLTPRDELVQTRWTSPPVPQVETLRTTYAEYLELFQLFVRITILNSMYLLDATVLHPTPYNVISATQIAPHRRRRRDRYRQISGQSLIFPSRRTLTGVACCGVS